MKKKLFLMVVMAVVFVMALTLTVCAESVHNESTVDYNATVTLDDGAVLPLYDASKEALTWYISGTDGDGKNVYSSVRSDSEFLHWNVESWGEVTSANITLADGTVFSSGTFVVVNMMDDDVKSNAPIGNHTNVGNPVTFFKFLFRGCKNLEYVYLRLDTTGLFKECFSGASKLKYVNLENLTKLERIGDSNNFSGCTSLFRGQVLDLSRTKLWSIDWDNSFNGVPLVGIKLPSTITRFGSLFENSGLVSISFPINIATVGGNMFKNCASLTTVCLNNKVTTIGDNAFYGCSSLNTVFFVGSLDQLNTTLAGVSATGNEAFSSVAQNVISYSDYMKLSDKSGKYLVYDYSWCEGYNDGNHEVTEVNPCVGLCSVCNNNIIKHSDEAELSVSIEYADFTMSGVKSFTCVNEGCTHQVTETAPAIFENKGFSYSATSVLQGFIVNHEALDAYELTGKSIKYGLAVASENALGETETLFEGTTLKAGVLSVSFDDKRQYSIFEMKVTGLCEEYYDTRLFICAYVIDGDSVSYISSGSDGRTVKSISYNELVANN